jgi:hypothetical protein
LPIIKLEGDDYFLKRAGAVEFQECTGTMTGFTFVSGTGGAGFVSSFGATGVDWTSSLGTFGVGLAFTSVSSLVGTASVITGRSS